MSENKPLYVVEAGRLVVTDAASGEVRWAGSPLDAAVSDVKAVPASERAVVLLDYMAQPSGPFRNLLCIGADGSVIWRAPLPTTSDDAYVSFDLAVDEIEANTWSGYRVRIAIDSGELLGKAFTK